MEVVETMQQGGNSIEPAVATYEECFLRRNFTSVIFVHCPTEANMAAHVIASMMVDAQTIVWAADPPEFLVDVLADDVYFFPKSI